MTNLNDAGPGSLRAACETPGPRIVVFRVGGLITLESPLIVQEPFITIAGHTAPGDGICLRGENLRVATHDVVVRFLRSRLGDHVAKDNDAISITHGSKNVIFDHCSASWSIDETFSPSGDIDNITVQWCLITESLRRSHHSKGAHGYGSLLRSTGRISLHHNLWAHHDARNPRLGDNFFRPPFPTYDVRNNVMYNYGRICTGLTDGTIKVNYVANYIKPGPSTANPAGPAIILSKDANENTRYYLADNFMEGQPEMSADNSLMFNFRERDGEPAVTIVSEPFEVAPVITTGPQEAYRAVLDRAGAILPVRDAVDQRIIADVRDGTGGLIDSQNEVGGWPEYPSAEPPVDSDGDGMPDDWEVARGLNPRDPSDAALIPPDGAGYTNIEIYLNKLAASRPGR